MTENTVNLTSCPCTYLDEPCKKNCSCKNSLSSAGCNFCYTYGDEQQKNKFIMKKSKEDLINIYNDTLERAEEIVGEKFTHSHNTVKEEINLNTQLSTLQSIKVVNLDSISAAIQTHQEHPYARMCVLNMASSKRPGGGVLNGAKAQEEDLFRCTNLGLCVTQEHYPLQENEYLYSEKIYIIKDKDYENVWPVEIDVVTMPAINLNPEKNNSQAIELPENYEEIMLSKIRSMCNAAIEREQDILLLGAWGCGVFKNNPKTVANFFYKVLVEEDYRKHFKKIIFPIINDKNSVGNNFDVFKKTFS